MCGIAGYFGKRSIDDQELERCLNRMRHRGPDHTAWKHFANRNGRNAYLLHSRLSIIDLDQRSNQPFHVGQKWLVYNGELYNYKELREGLEKKGMSFQTTSDTEVLLRSIDYEGWPCLDQYEGMWAFAIYDEENASLTLCRDRFGEKPLYLYRDETGLYFGSEIKFILELLGHSLSVNLPHLMRYLVNGYRSLYKVNQTFFEGITELPHACRLSISPDGKETLARYWTPVLHIENSMGYEEAVRETRNLMLRTVELRLRADVPLAFCMSGGVDSNSLIAVAKKIFGYDVHGYTIMNTNPHYEEGDIVKESVLNLGIRHTDVPLSVDGFLDKLRQIVIQHDGPLCTISYYAHWLLMKAIAADGYRISISGSGGDEFFAGYYDHHLFYLYEIRNDAKRLAQARKAWEEHIKPLVRNPYLRDPDVFIKEPTLRKHLFLDQDLFASRLKRPWFEPFREENYAEDLLRNRMMNELFHESIPPILHEDDLNAMAFSIENRSPLLDRRLFEFSLQIPTRHLIRDGYNKAVLRDAMKRIVPDSVLDSRRKVGFNAPIFSLLNVEDPQVRSRLLEDSPIFELVRRESIQGLIAKKNLPNSESLFLFYFLCGKFFLEAFENPVGKSVHSSHGKSQ